MVMTAGFYRITQLVQTYGAGSSGFLFKLSSSFHGDSRHLTEASPIAGFDQPPSRETSFDVLSLSPLDLCPVDGH